LQQLQQEIDLPSLERVLKRQKKFDIVIQSDEEMWQDFEQKIATLNSSKNVSINSKNWLFGFILLGLIAGGLWFYNNKK